MQRHLVIFARAPELGRVKRRLARDIGPIAAARFYRSTLIRQIRHLSADPRWTTWLFVTPDHSLHHPAWRGTAVGQGQGDLGQRMMRPFRILPPGPLVLVGSDIPKMCSSHIARAFRLLGRHDLVFGPASDGGFWLIGSRRTRPMPAALFDDVRWSSAHALGDVQARIPTRYSVALADILDDVDTAEDLRRLLLQRL